MKSFFDLTGNKKYFYLAHFICNGVEWLLTLIWNRVSYSERQENITLSHEEVDYIFHFSISKDEYFTQIREGENAWHAQGMSFSIPFLSFTVVA